MSAKLRVVVLLRSPRLRKLFVRQRDELVDRLAHSLDLLRERHGRRDGCDAVRCCDAHTRPRVPEALRKAGVGRQLWHRVAGHLVQLWSVDVARSCSRCGVGLLARGFLGPANDGQSAWCRRRRRGCRRRRRRGGRGSGTVLRRRRSSCCRRGRRGCADVPAWRRAILLLCARESFATRGVLLARVSLRDVQAALDGRRRRRCGRWLGGRRLGGVHSDGLSAVAAAARLPS